MFLQCYVLVPSPMEEVSSCSSLDNFLFSRARSYAMRSAGVYYRDLCWYYSKLNYRRTMFIGNEFLYNPKRARDSLDEAAHVDVTFSCIPWALVAPQSFSYSRVYSPLLRQHTIDRQKVLQFYTSVSH